MESGWRGRLMVADLEDEILWIFGVYTIHWLCGYIQFSLKARYSANGMFNSVIFA
jgi:hypothetical protein